MDSWSQHGGLAAFFVAVCDNPPLPSGGTVDPAGCWFECHMHPLIAYQNQVGWLVFSFSVFSFIHCLSEKLASDLLSK